MSNFKIYLKKGIINKPTQKGFISEYFKLSCPATFNNDKTIQCKAKAGRSFSDLYTLLCGHFKSPSKQKLAQHLLRLAISEKIRIMNCGGIYKMVFHSVKVHPEYWTLLNSKGEHNKHMIGRYDSYDINFIQLKNLAKNGE